MTEKPINMPEWEKWFGFKTLGDEQLESLLSAAAALVKDLRAGNRPRWLSLLGTSGAGKTYLARAIHQWVVRTRPVETTVNRSTGEVAFNAEWCSWPALAKELQSGCGRERLRDLASAKFLVLDDVGAARDNTGFVTGELSVLLGQRTNKWTLITANFSLEEVAAKIDARVASRMIREGGVVVDVDCMDYSLRGRS